MNGGRCEDEVNKYTCVCPAGKKISSLFGILPKVLALQKIDVCQKIPRNSFLLTY